LAASGDKLDLYLWSGPKVPAQYPTALAAAATEALASADPSREQQQEADAGAASSAETLGQTHSLNMSSSSPRGRAGTGHWTVNPDPFDCTDDIPYQLSLWKCSIQHLELCQGPDTLPGLGKPVTNAGSNVCEQGGVQADIEAVPYETGAQTFCTGAQSSSAALWVDQGNPEPSGVAEGVEMVDMVRPIQPSWQQLYSWDDVVQAGAESRRGGWVQQEVNATFCRM
jgi:hypothetical protein